MRLKRSYKRLAPDLGEVGRVRVRGGRVDARELAAEMVYFDTVWRLGQVLGVQELGAVGAEDRSWGRGGRVGAEDDRWAIIPLVDRAQAPVAA